MHGATEVASRFITAGDSDYRRNVLEVALVK